MAENKQDFPEEVKARQEILEIGGRMYAKGFVAANDGNISCLVSPNRVVITPAGISKGFMTEESLGDYGFDGTGTDRRLSFL